MNNENIDPAETPEETSEETQAENSVDASADVVEETAVEETVDASADGEDETPAEEPVDAIADTNNKPTPETSSDTSAKTKKSSRIPSSWIAIGAFVAIFAVFVGFTVAFRRGGLGGNFSYTAPSSLSKEEMTLLVKDLSPMQQKTLTETPEQRQKLAEELSGILSMAKQAEREGITKKDTVLSELKFIEAAVTANNFEQKINKDKPKPEPMQQQAPFSSVTEAQVNAFWKTSDVTPGILDKIGWKTVTPESRLKEFQAFIDGKIALAKESGQLGEEMKPSEEELKMAKDIFAKTQIMQKQAHDKFQSASGLPEAEKKDWLEFESSVKLQVKLQQAQFLSQYYGQNVLSKKLEVTDADVEKYLKEHPELGDKTKKKQTAEEVLKKIKDGGDFGALAKEFSEDPGSKDKGGLYENVKSGAMAPGFEKAALALEAGKVSESVVETDFGYHIIKLESKKESKDEQGKPTTEYNVRHILISTQITDPTNPTARPMSAKDFVKSKLQGDREKQLLDEIKKNNPVTIPLDFEVPKISEEELKKQMEQQQQMMMPQGGPPPQQMPEGGPPPAAKPPAPEAPAEAPKAK